MKFFDEVKTFRFRRARRRQRSRVSEKIALLRREGYGQKQAVAIALSMERRGELG